MQNGLTVCIQQRFIDGHCKALQLGDTAEWPEVMAVVYETYNEGPPPGAIHPIRLQNVLDGFSSHQQRPDPRPTAPLS